LIRRSGGEVLRRRKISHRRGPNLLCKVAEAGMDARRCQWEGLSSRQLRLVDGENPHWVEFGHGFEQESAVCWGDAFITGMLRGFWKRSVAQKRGIYSVSRAIVECVKTAHRRGKKCSRRGSRWFDGQTSEPFCTTDQYWCWVYNNTFWKGTDALGYWACRVGRESRRHG